MGEHMKLIYRGAEAELWLDHYLGEKVIKKVRVEKPYKHPALDEKLRVSRTRNEAKMLSAARKAVPTPHVYGVEKYEITMEFIDGERVKEMFYEGRTRVARRIGESIRKLHDINVIHNDLTTSNMLIGDGVGKDKIYFVDFGLAKVSNELEDKATDLVVFKKMLASTHYDVFDKVWGRVLEGYGATKQIINKISEIEKRAKYM